MKKTPVFVIWFIAVVFAFMCIIGYDHIQRNDDIKLVCKTVGLDGKHYGKRGSWCLDKNGTKISPPKNTIAIYQ